MALVGPAIEPLVGILHKEVSTDILVDAVWALSYLSDGANERIERVMRSGVTKRLVQFLENKSSALLTPTIRCLGNFATGSDIQTDIVLEAGILQHLAELLDNPKVCLVLPCGSIFIFSLNSPLLSISGNNSEGIVLAGFEHRRRHTRANICIDEAEWRDEAAD
jgi:hypothetical protein